MQMKYYLLKRVNFERRRVISNHIDHIWGIDLITMI